MFGFMKKVFQSNNHAAVRRPLSARLGVDVLEGRCLPSTTPYFTLVLPHTAAAGAIIDVAVVEHGPGGINNNTVTPNASLTANLSFEASGASVSLGSVTVFDGLGATAVKLPTYPVSGEIVAIAGSITGGTPITIIPGPLTHYAVSAPSQATAGTPFQVTVTAEDALGNTITTDNQVPTLAAGSGAVSGYNWFDGVGTATVTQDAATTMTITATSGSITGSTTTTTIAATATHFVFTTLPSSVTSGVSNIAEITAEDAFGNPVKNFNQNVTFTTTYGLPVSVTPFGWSIGYEEFSYRLTAPGVTRLTATAGSVTGTSGGTDVLQTFWGPPNWWAGYEVNGLSNVTGVGASWVQPRTTGPKGSDALIWVGIDGDGSSTVEQCGTKAYVDNNGVTHYVAWYELFGDQTPSTQNPNPNPTGPDYFEQYISGFNVQPGDTISARVSLLPGSTNSFVFQMTDRPVNGGAVENFTLVQTPTYVTAARSTAEWIVENDHVPAEPLANFGQVTFTGAWAETGATRAQPPTIGSIYSFPGAQAVDMLNSSGVAVAIAGDASLSNSTGYGEPVGGTTSSNFTVTWSPGNGTTGAAPSKAFIGAQSAAAAQNYLDALDSLDASLHHRDEWFW